MGFRFRKTVSLGKGLRFNISKSGISTSVGPRGASMTFGKNGTYANVGIPGTGLSYRRKIGEGKNRRGVREGQRPSVAQQIAERTGDLNFVFDVAMQDDGKLVIIDSSGLPIADTELVSLIKRSPEYKEKKTRLESLRNEELKELSNLQQEEMENMLGLHKSAPRIKSRMDYEHSISVLRPKDASPEAKIHYEKKRRRLQAALDGDASFIEWKTEKWLEICEVPVEISASYEYDENAKAIKLDLNLPEIEQIPDTYVELLASGKYKEKNKAKKRINEEYERLVKSLCVYVAANVLNVSNAIQHVVISGFTDRRDKTGALKSEYIVSVDFTRSVMAALSFQNQEPDLTISKFDNRQNVLSNGIMKSVEPL